ncbi:transglutaminase family protein [Mesorhizobium sp. NZP2077]|uniref:transglutaminase-like domain-containing protein n=1 Tax=Mesorhizobium sp. NZP2077 TaxID=2483404 RepID=UPI001551CC9F|nr:transglutaminase family protein [Mesorhizobium sp. NZP2077]QKC80741.1 transglutaminase family protein [Mesorhizobium sp. NZP2077]QKD14135.1 transglutaminase family protein [Mesorhizobium sp. NZP2077]
MRIHIGCEMSFDFPQETPLIAMLNVHYSRASDLERPDFLTSNPPVPIESYRDSFGNWCNRFVAPPGRFTFGTDAVIRAPGTFEMSELMAWQHEVRDLPAETLLFLLPSRFCESDLLASEAWRLFGHTPLGIPRVQAVCDFVHNHIVFSYGNARPTRTAAETYREQSGVCRDFAHLAVTFCRALNIPTRYCTGYISDIGMPKPWSSMDFAAWMEVYLGGRWHVFDPRNNAPRIGRILIASGRDAADVPLTHIFGPGLLAGFKVWTDEIVE